ncbi:hypothetical protein ACPVPU_12175 [Sphingomonas sp. CJ99]
MASYKHPLILEQGGYRITYHADEPNHCPGCGNSHWLVGRITAECAHCATAIPLAGGSQSGAGLFVSVQPGDTAPLAA